MGCCFVAMRWKGEIKGLKKKAGDEVVVVEGGEEVVSRRAALFLSIASFGMSMTFLSQNITGNVVAGFGRPSANWVGGVFFVLAMVGFLVYVQKKKK